MKHALALALLVLCGAAPASADTMDATYGNTVEVRHPSGVVERYYFEPGGAFNMVAEDGRTYSGEWRTEAGNICVSARGETHCSPLPADEGVGGGWAIDTPNGSIAVTIVEGR